MGSFDYPSPSSNDEIHKPTPVSSVLFTVQEPDSEQTLVSVSRAFHPRAQLDPLEPDVIIVTNDEVFFYVHHHVLVSASQNNFNFHLPDNLDHAVPLPFILPLPEHSNEVNIVLHTMYHLSCNHYAPTFETLLSALGILRKYGIALSLYTSHFATPLFGLLLSHAPAHPLEIYAIAAENRLEELAVAVSPFLLSFQFSSLTDEMAIRLGALYMKRLWTLQHNRLAVLRQLILALPYMHPVDAESSCDQGVVIKAWAQAVEELAWEARPDLTCNAIQVAFMCPGFQFPCSLCKDLWNARVQEIVTEWSLTKRTI
ncbi:hypothetical protein EW026_g3658 [Hermanssonia centrifuga]|uniref:BTB domain-containing protein n=1 Tax=Hermanssonia centrifuga TaxID=98765 RepID=A0A4S4KJG8_9APHY|nr:hypothetical protein EW026_g3658 [Hermanssonia centrifuga]